MRTIGSTTLCSTEKNDLTVTVEETKLVGAADFLELPVWHTLMMKDPRVKEATKTFLQHGHFVTEAKRNPIEAKDKE